MNDYSVIIPIHNLFTRGYDRLVLQVLSLTKQTRKPKEIFIPDSSAEPYFSDIDLALKKFEPYPFKVNHFHVETGGVFNMPKKFNRAIEKTSTEYVLCTGADFIYSRNLFEIYAKYEGPDKFLLKEVWNLSPIDLTPDQVLKWNIPGKKRKHPAGRGADGIQYAPTEFFKKIGGYDERMEGWGGMDNDLHKRAEASKDVKCLWVEGGLIYHIWHKTEKGGPDTIGQTRKNWKILDNDKTINRGFIK